MTWYAAHVADHGHHELIGTLLVEDDAVLREHKSTIIHGTDKHVAIAPLSRNVAPLATIRVPRVFVKLQEVWSEREVLFRYVTVEDVDRSPAERLLPTYLLDPKLDWIGATFVPLGAPLMCEWCPDRKRT